MLEIFGLKPCRTQVDADLALLSGTLRKVTLTKNGVHIEKPYVPMEDFLEAEKRLHRDLGFISISTPQKPAPIDFVI